MLNRCSSSFFLFFQLLSTTKLQKRIATHNLLFEQSNTSDSGCGECDSQLRARFEESQQMARVNGGISFYHQSNNSLVIIPVVSNHWQIPNKGMTTTTAITSALNSYKTKIISRTLYPLDSLQPFCPEAAGCTCHVATPLVDALAALHVSAAFRRCSSQDG